MEYRGAEWVKTTEVCTPREEPRAGHTGGCGIAADEPPPAAGGGGGAGSFRGADAEPGPATGAAAAAPGREQPPSAAGGTRGEQGRCGTCRA